MDLNHNFKKTLDDIKKKGWGFIESYSSESDCDAIKNTLNTPKFPVNLNQPYPTFQGGTKFNNNVLTLSKEAFDVVTRNELIELAKSFVNDEVILKCIRTYSISKKYPLFEWHSDNVHPITFKADNSLGINCILYLEDDFEGTFWVAENMFHDSTKKYPVPQKDEIEGWKLKNKIKKIKAKKGDMVLFNQSIYHRHIAEKIEKLDALWFQISDKKNGTNERILIDISFIPNDLKILDFLGSGQKNIGFSNPNTKIHQLPFHKLIEIGIFCFLIAPLSLFVLLGKKIDKFLYFFLGINLSKVRNFFRKKVKSLILK